MGEKTYKEDGLFMISSGDDCISKNCIDEKGDDRKVHREREIFVIEKEKKNDRMKKKKKTKMPIKPEEKIEKMKILYACTKAIFGSDFKRASKKKELIGENKKQTS